MAQQSLAEIFGGQTSQANSDPSTSQVPLSQILGGTPSQTSSDPFSSPPSTINPPSNPVGSFLQGTIGGLYQGTANTIGAGMNFAQSNLLNPTANALRLITGQKAENIPLTGNIMTAAGAKINQPSAPGQIGIGPQPGDVGGQIGEFVGNTLSQAPAMMAGGAVGDAVTEGAAAIPALAKAAPLLGAAANGAAVAEGSTMASSGKLASPTDLAMGAALGGGLHVLGGVAGEVAKYASSAFSGVPVAAIEQAFSNPAAVQGAIKSAVQDGGDETAQRIMQQAQDALQSLKDTRAQAYQDALANLEKTTMTTKAGQLYVQDAQGVYQPTNLTTQGIKTTATQTLQKFGGVVDKGVLDASGMAIDNSHASQLQQVLDRVYNWSDNSPTGINKLRQIVDSYQPGGINPSSSEKQFGAMITKMSSGLDNYLTDRVPQIGTMNQGYAQQSQVIDGINQQLKMSSNDPNTALRKLLNVFNPKSTVYRPIVEKLGQEGGKDLMSDIAGLTMSKWTPEGIGKYLTGSIEGTGGMSALLNPATATAALPAMLGTAAASSPRLVGAAATGLGHLAQTGIPSALTSLGESAAFNQNNSNLLSTGN